ncbi:protein mono-ADP-ribosyltransferase PARP4 isoform 2-T2 [Odontesthes bonariensis]|uniref:protein mono-ADP-ribosyltransferase PARP4 isoform X2 n=1 Tax=Odontesthes bonariensis TaxID=219752 RepID=UPI003F58D27A
MAVFENLLVLLELKHLTFKEKKKLKSAVTENGGSVCFVVNKQCSLVVTGDVSSLSSNRLRSIQKHQTPVVGVNYVFGCVEAGVLLPVDEYKLDARPAVSAPPPPPSSLRRAPPISRESKAAAGKPAAERSRGPVPAVRLTERTETAERRGNVLDEIRVYAETDSDLPAYPDDFQVAKYAIFEKMNSWCVLELQSVRTELGRRYRVVVYRKDGAEKAALRDQLVFPSTSEKAVDVFQALRNTLEAAGLRKRSGLPPEASGLGSAPLQQLLLEEKLNTGSLSQEAGLLVELLWTEALGCLSDVLRVSIEQLSLSDVSRAEGLLLQAQKKLTEGNLPEASSLLEEVYVLLPHREDRPPNPSTRLLSQKLDLCQLIRDVLSVSEMTLGSSAPTSVGKYRALRCSIEPLLPCSSEFQAVARLLQNSRVWIQQIARVTRGAELQSFRNELGNVKPLLHSSSPSNFVGILSRGLLPPLVGVGHHGIERTDIGNLGSGIYFGDALSTSLKYSKPSRTDGSRLLLVCDVALGRCRDLHKRDPALTQAPDGHHSVHGVRHTKKTPSEFEDDEYVVYSPDQVKLKYVVQFLAEGEQLKDFSPEINTSAELPQPSSDQELSSEDEAAEDIKNPLEDVTAGLLDGSGQQLPLQAVHVKCKLMDLLSQVIIFQKYTNLSSVPIEAKYVFPLDDSAAVCGFEAFINGKHVVGQVKEKEKARKEYKQAVEKGHGAYLMDQDAPDVFTISVGNLPPGATVLIKVTFVSELVVRDGRILFSLPGSVAPWQQSAALNQTTQVTTEKVCVTDEEAGSREFTLDASVEMPHEISSLLCTTHRVKMKRTDCKAVVSVLPGQVMDSDGFQLSVILSEVHLPRMWVEKHPDKESQACMLVFYPDFEPGSGSGSDEVVLLLDTSESMRGESLGSAQRIALQVLRKLDNNLKVNVVLFGTDHTEAFLSAQPLTEARQAAESFIRRCSPVGGSTELWRPLRALGLLPPSCGGVRNLLLLSDGHIQDAAVTLQLLRDAEHSRLFTCGLSSTANRHMLRALAQAGGGAYEFFDAKTKHNWAEKVERQVERMSSVGCSSVSVKWQQFNPTAPPPVQAPQQLHALFRDCHSLVYGFVPHCTQATLLGNLCGQEVTTMVSTSELQKTRGTFLHKLTARALIRDYEDGNLDSTEAEHEGKKAELKSFITELSKEFSILSQFTSFVAIEERDSEQAEDGVTDIPQLMAEEDVDFLPNIGWASPVPVDISEYSGLDSYSNADEDSGEDWDLNRHKNVVFYDDYEEGLCLVDETVETEELTSYEDRVENIFERGVILASGTSNSSESYVMMSAAMDLTQHSAPPPPRTRDSEQAEDGVTDIPQLMAEEDLDFLPNIGWASPVPVDISEKTLQRGVILGLEASSSSESVMMGAAMDLTQNSDPPPRPPHSYSDRRCLMPAPPSPCFSALPPPPPPSLAPPPLPSSAPPPRPPHSYSDRRCLMPAPPSACFSALPPPPPSLAPPPLPSSAPPPRPPHFYSDRRCLMPAPPSFCFSALPPPPPSLAPPPLPSSAPPPHFSAPPPPPPLPSLAPPPLPSSAPPPHFSAPPPPPSSAPPPVLLEAISNPIPQTSQDMSEDVDIGLFGFGPKVECSGFLFGRPAPLSSAVGMVSSLKSSPKKQSMKKKRIDVLNMPARAPAACSTESEIMRPMRGSAESLMSQSKSGRPALDPFESNFQSLQPRFGARRSFRGKAASSYQGSASPSVPARPCSDWTQLDTDSGEPKHDWAKIFQLQRSEGFWELNDQLGQLINLNVDVFANVFLKNKGICSLGVKAHSDILRMVATLLVLQLMRMEKMEEASLLQSLFRLEESAQLRPERWEQVRKAVDWVCRADRQYPCICSRLEFGLSWESSTRQLLGYDGLPPFSPLRGLELQMTPLMEY